MEGKDASAAPPAGAPQPAAPAPPAAGQPQPPEAARWGTRQMGPPAAPGAHPENQEAARGTAARGDQELPPYVVVGEPVPQQVGEPVPQQQRQKGDSPMEHILDFFNSWSRKAEELASNIWFNRKASLPNPAPSFPALLCFGRSVSQQEQRILCFSSSPEQRRYSAFGGKSCLNG